MHRLDSLAQLVQVVKKSQTTLISSAGHKVKIAKTVKQRILHNRSLLLRDFVV